MSFCMISLTTTSNHLPVGIGKLGWVVGIGELGWVVGIGELGWVWLAQLVISAFRPQGPWFDTRLC